tara:strand:+ start:821 stop:955 length:135 start_codon:yes stop_codon:yes gene_type:complete
MKLHIETNLKKKQEKPKPKMALTKIFYKLTKNTKDKKKKNKKKY